MKEISPIPRKGIYELYWKFAYERQKAFENRANGKPAPWSNDKIIQEYKFCNAYRAADRVSQFLIRNICYSQEKIKSEDKLFQITAFRIFSNINTWQQLVIKLGHSPKLDDLKNNLFEKSLNEIKDESGKLYTGAFILCATNAYERNLKHLNHVELLKDMFLNQKIGKKILAAASLKEIYLMLHSFPLMGDFMSYQIAIDLNYSDLINFSENNFTKAGPGAKRGINKVFQDKNGLSEEEIIIWMVNNQDKEFSSLGYKFNGLYGRKLHAIDCQNIFCETDKYCRVAAPKLKSNRTKIKSHFHKSAEPIELFFPPKWGINKFIK
ncbi:MAG: nucleotide kinase domain-containing protein [Candidatus Saccharibacteria bacterium]